MITIRSQLAVVSGLSPVNAAILSLGVGFLIGMLAEPITWEFLDAGHFAGLLPTVLIASVVLAGAIVILGWRVRNL